MAPSGHYENHYIGNDPARWGTGCPVFGAVTLHEVWPGVDLHIDGSSGLKYELYLSPGSAHDAVRFRYEGHHELLLEEGRLTARTSAGDMSEEAPYSFLTDDPERTVVPSRYRLEGDEVSFDMPSGYDRTRGLTIDPSIAFSSLSGSSGNNFGFTATYDADGHLYGAGIVFAPGYPTTLGVLDDSYADDPLPSVDIGVSKWSTDGTTLVWSTYIGGLGSEAPHSMVANEEGELFIFGHTGSDDFPTTPGCVDATFGGGSPPVFNAGSGFNQPDGADMFLLHLDQNATALVGSTYVGGPENDGLNTSLDLAHNYGDAFRGEVVLMEGGDVVVASMTSSTGLPTPGGPQPTFGGGSQDGYLFRMDQALTTLVWATYVGGSGDDAAYGVQLDSSDELFATGGTTSTDLPLAGAAMQPFNAGGVDGFIAHYSAAGGAQATTYIGTPAYDQCYFVQLNTNDDVYVVGQTHGPYPVTPGKYTVAGSSQFVHKVDHALDASQWSTVFGNGDIQQDLSPTAFLVSNCGQIYFSGWGGGANQSAGNFASTTTGTEVTADAYQGLTDGADIYLMVLQPEAVDLGYATFFGGNLSAEHVDGGTSRFDKDGNVYQAVCAGCQGNSDFPTTPGAWSATNNSFGCNLGVVKFDLDQPDAEIAIDGPTAVCIPGSVQFVNLSSGGDTYLWQFGDGGTSTEFAPLHTYTEAGTYSVSMQLFDSFGCSVSDTTDIEVTALDLPEAGILPPPPACPGDSIQVQALPADTWEWSPTTGVSDPSAQDPFILPAEPYIYRLVVTNPCGSDTANVTLQVVDPVGSAGADAAACVGQPVQLAATGGGTYTWSPPEPLSDPASASPFATLADTTLFFVDIITPDGCLVRDSVLITTYLVPPLPVLQDTTICVGATLALTADEGYSYQWSPPELVDAPASRSVVVAPAVPTLFIVAVDNGCGSILDSVFVNLNTSFIRAWPDTAICPGDTVQLFASEGLSYSWSPATGLDDPGIRTPLAIVNTNTTFQVLVTDLSGCGGAASVQVDMLPVDGVVAYQDAAIEFGETVQLSAIGNGTFSWSPSSTLDDASIATPIAAPLGSTTYTVRMFDVNGCSTTDEVTIVVRGSLYIPNTFTPDGDGNNDRFGAWGVDIAELELMVFDRWGEFIWNAATLEDRWDGNCNGVPAPIDTYVWKVRAKDLTGAIHDRVGHVNLIR